MATILFIGRLVIRGVLLKKFHLDDAFGALAWFLLLVSMICATIQTPLTYHFSSILIGETPAPSEEEMADMTITLRRWNVAVETLFWTSLYSVKLSFMFLYRYVLRSGGRNKHIAVWSAALVYIILCYGICLIGVYGQCGDVRNLFTYRKSPEIIRYYESPVLISNLEQCMTPYVASLIPKLIWISFFFNVTSDLVGEFVIST